VAEPDAISYGPEVDTVAYGLLIPIQMNAEAGNVIGIVGYNPTSLTKQNYENKNKKRKSN